jgi:hypothetical protein
MPAIVHRSAGSPHSVHTPRARAAMSLRAVSRPSRPTAWCARVRRRGGAGGAESSR